MDTEIQERFWEVQQFALGQQPLTFRGTLAEVLALSEDQSRNWFAVARAVLWFHRNNIYTTVLYSEGFLYYYGRGESIDHVELHWQLQLRDPLE